MRLRKRNSSILLIILALLLLLTDYLKKEQTPPSPSTHIEQRHHSLQDITSAIEQRASRAWVKGHGTVVALLKDDTHGARHQRILITVRGAEKTVLIAHNIDLAPRVPNLRKGTPLDFTGEYIWNDKGGVLHWTHHDPDGRHPGGWLKVEQKKYD